MVRDSLFGLIGIIDTFIILLAFWLGARRKKDRGVKRRFAQGSRVSNVDKSESVACESDENGRD